MGGRWEQTVDARAGELWRLTAAALLSTTGGALIGPTAVWVVSGTYSWPAAAVWMTRNTVSILLISAVWLTCAYAWRTGRKPGWWASVRAGWANTSPLRRGEYIAVVVVSAAAYYGVFGIDHGLPLAFSVLGHGRVAGARLNTRFVVVHDLIFGAAAVLFTLHGTGAFANIGSHPARALVAQAFVGVIAVAGLALAVGRDERRALFQ